jgi:prepilin-type processing-associated H-X9-DG protein
MSLFNAANFCLCTINDTTPFTGNFANSTVTNTRLNTFLCPSSTPPSYTQVALSYSTSSPGNNYFSSFGASIEFKAEEPGGPPNGPFYYVYTLGSVCRLAKITDGTTNTIAFGEWKSGGGNQNVISSPTDIVFYGQFPPGVSRNTAGMVMPGGQGPFLQWIQGCAVALKTARIAKTPTLGMNWAYNITGWAMGNTLLPPNPRYPNCDTSSTSGNTLTSPGMYGLSSFHPGGANVLMCDGSCKFLKDSVSMQTIWSLGSIAQGEVISADAY